MDEKKDEKPISVEEAVKHLQKLYIMGGDLLRHNRPLRLWYDDLQAILVVLDEFRALQECKSCQCSKESE